MNIIHYNPHNDIVIAEYIDTLNMAMTDEVVSRKASTVKEIKKELTAQHADYQYSWMLASFIAHRNVSCK